MVDITHLGLAELAAEPAWWGVERDALVADPSGIFCMIALGMDEGLPTPISVDTRPWTVEMIIQVAPSHRDAWRDWWHHHDAGPWAVTQQRHGRYIHHRSYGHWRGWRIVILHVEDEQ